MKWIVSVCLEETRVENFKDAVEALMVGVKEQMGNNSNLSWQVLETTCYVKHEDTDQPPIPFPTVRDLACDLGWLVDGKFNF